MSWIDSSPPWKTTDELKSAKSAGRGTHKAQANSNVRQRLAALSTLPCVRNDPKLQPRRTPPPLPQLPPAAPSHLSRQPPPLPMQRISFHPPTLQRIPTQHNPGFGEDLSWSWRKGIVAGSLRAGSVSILTHCITTRICTREQRWHLPCVMPFSSA